MRARCVSSSGRGIFTKSAEMWPGGRCRGVGRWEAYALQVFFFVGVLSQKRLGPMPVDGGGIRHEEGVVGQGELVAGRTLTPPRAPEKALQ